MQLLPSSINRSNPPPMDELFDTLTRIIAHPHTAITDHDRIRGAKAIIEVSDFYLGYFTDDAPNLYLYARRLLDELEGRGKINKNPLA